MKTGAVLFSITLVIFAVGCGNTPSESQELLQAEPTPSATKTAAPTATVTVTPSSLMPDMINQVAPSDVIQEVVFFPGGAGGGYSGCDGAYTSPEVGQAPDSAEEWQLIAISTCGWKSEEQISVEILHPGGDTEYQELVADRYGELEIDYTVPWQGEDGIYTFIMKNQEISLQHKVLVVHPLEPRLYVSDLWKELFFYNFLPAETVRLLIYQNDELFGWTEYIMRLDGNLVVSTSSGLGGQYAAIGDNSGQVTYRPISWHDSINPGWTVGDIYCKGAPPPIPNMDPNSFVQVIVETVTVYEDLEDMSGEMVLPKGTHFKFLIENSPKCKNKMFWHWGVSELDFDHTYWIPEVGEMNIILNW